MRSNTATLGTSSSKISAPNSWAETFPSCTELFCSWPERFPSCTEFFCSWAERLPSCTEFCSPTGGFFGCKGSILHGWTGQTAVDLFSAHVLTTELHSPPSQGCKKEQVENRWVKSSKEINTWHINHLFNLSLHSTGRLPWHYPFHCFKGCPDFLLSLFSPVLIAQRPRAGSQQPGRVKREFLSSPEHQPCWPGQPINLSLIIHGHHWVLIKHVLYKKNWI